MVIDYESCPDICQPDGRMKVYHWCGELLDALFPPACRLCGARTQISNGLCKGCLQDLPRLGLACQQCARPLQGTTSLRCARCQRQPPRFDATMALFHYQPPVDYLLKRLKFAHDHGIGALLAGLLAEPLKQRGTALPDLLLPMPLHPSRLRERGYNQATEIARPLAETLAIPLRQDLCRRTRPTQAQSLLGTTARRLNVRHAFAVSAPMHVRHVAIVDDVMTTGSSAGELARVIKQAGVVEVEVWVIARAIRHDQ